jgi:DNA-binding CsgD family transcriptional regulator
VHSNLTRPGLIVMDSSSAVLAYNGEALKILTYPEQPEKIRHVENWLANKICTDLAGRHSPPKLANEFRSARRVYLCRHFPLERRAHTGNGSTSNGALQIIMLERKSNEAVKLAEVAERFGLTAREQETVRYLLEGFTSKEIAQHMNISPNTVKAFLRLVMVKMSVSTRSGIIGRIASPHA